MNINECDLSGELAPVAVFVYNRIKNTKEVLDALKRNELAERTDVYIFSDAPKYRHHQEDVMRVRAYVRNLSGFRSVKVVERQTNYYIEKNVIDGISYVLNRHDRVIVLEDDGVSDRRFLRYANAALIKYAEQKKVMHIAAFTFINPPKSPNLAFFWRYCENTGGGWATWRNRWEKFQYFPTEADANSVISAEDRNYIQFHSSIDFLATLKLRPVPWDICWYIAVARNRGLALQSPIPLVRNNGLYNGTHFGLINRFLGKSPFETRFRPDVSIELPELIEEDSTALSSIANFYASIKLNKRAKLWNCFVRVLVLLRVTKALKKIYHRLEV